MPVELLPDPHPASGRLHLVAAAAERALTSVTATAITLAATALPRAATAHPLPPVACGCS